MNDYITTTKQSTTKPCAYFLGYTVGSNWFLACNPPPQRHIHILPAKGWWPSYRYRWYRLPNVAWNQLTFLLRYLIAYALSLQDSKVKMALANTVSANGDFPYEKTVSLYEPLDPSNVSDYDNHVYYRQDSALHRALEIYVTPSLTAVSLIGNALIFAVFSKRFYKTNLTAMLYQVLAATDGISVIIRLVYHVMAPAAISCNVIMFLLCWSRIVSGWLIVVITAARVIMVWFPHKSKQINTKRKYGFIFAALSVVSCLICVPLFATAGYNNDNDMDRQPRFCMFFRRDNVGKMEWFRLVFKIIIVVSVLTRLLFVFIANGFIVYGIKKSRRTVNSTVGSNDVDKRKNKNATIILWISSTSVLFGLPDVIYAALSTYYDDSNSDAYSPRLVFRDFLPVFDCINRSINIIFFCVFGAEFRQRLKELFSAPCKITHDISNSLTSSTRVWVCIFGKQLRLAWGEYVTCKNQFVTIFRRYPSPIIHPI